MDINQNNNNKNQNNNKNNKQGWGLVIATTLITAFLVLGMMQFSASVSTKEISYTEFLEMVDKGEVEEVIIESDQLAIKPKAKEGENSLLSSIDVTYYTGLVEDDTMVQRLVDAGVEVSADIPDTAGAFFWNIMLTVILPFVLIFWCMNHLMKKMSKGGMMGIGKSHAKMYVEQQTGVTFKDVAGQDEA